MRTKRSPSRDELVCDPANANRGTERGRQLVRASLAECGAGRSILADRDGVVIAGNKTYEAAKALGLPVKVVESDGAELVVVKRSDLAVRGDERARRLAYLDNRTSELGLEWDQEQVLADLTAGVDLAGIFSGPELAELLATPTAGRSDPDELPAAPAKALTRPGDLWKLDGHRLLCGDATKVADVAHLMGDERAGLMVTDPPYLVSYNGGNHPQTWGNGGKQAGRDVATKNWDDYRDHDQAVTFYRDFLKAALEGALTPDAAVYQCYAILRSEFIWQAWREADLLPHQVCVWKKSRAVLTHSWFLWDFEPIMVGWHEGHQPKMKPPADARAVWEIDSSEGNEAAISSHPTVKPVELYRRPIEWHTRAGQPIFEPFCGSGTAIIAAEMTGRRCYALELQPTFCDLALVRWQNFTGKRAVLEVRHG
jgi:DNA modification methylase